MQGIANKGMWTRVWRTLLPRRSLATSVAGHCLLLLLHHNCFNKNSISLQNSTMLTLPSFPLLHTSSSSTFIRYSGASQRCLCDTRMSSEPTLTDTRKAAFEAGYSGTSQRCLCDTRMSSESTLTDTRKAAFEAGNGAELVAFYSDHHVVNLPQGHRFPMDKYRATRLMLEDDASLVNFFFTRPSPAASIEELCLVHEERYVQNILKGELNEKEQRNLGFPWSLELVNRSRASIGGTVAAMHCVMLGLRRAAANIAGGTHHAFPGHGEGFCVFNDIAVAARVALEAYPEICSIERPILVIDLDVHQGNGTAKIFEKDDRIVTFSIHGANNYPWRTKMKSDYDVDLPDDTGDRVYLAVLSDWLQRLFSSHNPSLIFFQAGVDALREDSFGRLAMSRQGLLQRNNMVYTACLTRELPLVITMGGGYSRPSEASVLAHADVYRAAALRYGAISRTPHGSKF